MKVYAVIERCEDDFYPDYTIVDDCVYSKEEDAKKRLDELVKENRWWSDFKICDFEVKMPEEHHDCLNCSASMSDDDEKGNMILRCSEHDGKIVDENDCCDEWR